MYYNNRDVRLEEFPKPKIGPGEILVKVVSSGICGSDVLEWYRVKKAPLVLGHEIAGDIVEVGEGVKKYKVGDKVFVAHHVPCDSCHYCLSGNETVCQTLHTTNYFPGGFSEYIRIPKINVEKGVLLIPKEVSYDEATLIEPLACVIRGQRMAQLKKGQSVIILGAGLSGLLHLMLAKNKGAKPAIVTDINEYRLKCAKDFGADSILNAKEEIISALRKTNNGNLADLVIVCTGASSAFQQALECVDRAGTILFFAAPLPGEKVAIPVNDFWRLSIKLMHSYGASPKDAQEALGIIREKTLPLAKMITHCLPLEKAGEGFKLVSEAKECMKVVIKP
jgi:L-iditol 2-dehydrogenase